MRGVCKRFPGVVALDRVDFDLRAGEVHVLLGENGAGKSTLMKILSGAYRKDAGEILISGRHAAIEELGSASVMLGSAAEPFTDRNPDDLPTMLAFGWTGSKRAHPQASRASRMLRGRQ